MSPKIRRVRPKPDRPPLPPLPPDPKSERFKAHALKGVARSREVRSQKRRDKQGDK